MKQLTVNTRSKYAIRCVESWADGWEKDAQHRGSTKWQKANGEDVANQDLIEKLIDLTSRLTLKWVLYLKTFFYFFLSTIL